MAHKFGVFDAPEVEECLILHIHISFYNLRLLIVSCWCLYVMHLACFHHRASAASIDLWIQILPTFGVKTSSHRLPKLCFEFESNLPGWWVGIHVQFSIWNYVSLLTKVRTFLLKEYRIPVAFLSQSIEPHCSKFGWFFLNIRCRSVLEQMEQVQFKCIFKRNIATNIVSV